MCRMIVFFVGTVKDESDVDDVSTVSQTMLGNLDHHAC